MNPRSDKRALSLIVYDADRIQHPQAQLFDVGFWKAQGCVVGEAVGRGSAWFLETPFGSAVLREYLRGGWPGRFIRDRYVFTGWSRSRPVAEFNILVELHRLGLPVPRQYVVSRLARAARAADRIGVMGIVGNEDNAQSPRPSLRNIAQHRAGLFHAERCRRFIEDDDLRPEGCSTGHGHTLALTARHGTHRLRRNQYPVIHPTGIIVVVHTLSRQNSSGGIFQ